MMSIHTRTPRATMRFAGLIAGALALTTAFSGCASTGPLAGESHATPDGGPLVVGSQDYYSNEIIAEIYAQALEAQNIEVDREFRIGQREAYLPEIESGNIDLFPEYTGNLLQYFDADTEARLPDDVYSELSSVMPNGLRVLTPASATDQDSYVVTREFADAWGLSTIDDLANVTEPLTFGGNSEAETRPYGPAGLEETYGIGGVSFAPIEDSGGPLTVKALMDGDIQFADIYSADPSINRNDFVVLEDTEGIFLASQVVPIASDRVNEEAEDVIDAVNASLTGDELVALNARSVDEELPAEQIAKEWLAEHELV